jgi:hypothetical protein
VYKLIKINLEKIMRKLPFNTSISIETLEIIDEMRERKIIPSHFFEKALKALKANGFEYPVTIKNDEPVI